MLKIKMNQVITALKWSLAVAPMLLTLSFEDKALNHALPETYTEKTTISTIVIDAGHGGKDPGCNGASKREKDVCLAMALELGRSIKEKYPTIKVVYTRDKDVFIELDDRANIANKAKADLFICIHANSASPSAFGTETYVLGLHKTDAQARIADRENSVINLEEDKGEKYKNFDLSPDALIARQLQLSVFLDQSINIAGKLQKEFKGIGRYDRGVKQAGFLVLYKTTMPSVLIETGFLTNPDEEKFLGDTAGQNKMAHAMFVAFDRYKSEVEGIEYTSEPVKATPNNAASNPEKGTETPELAGTEKKDKVYFKVQVETSESKIALNSIRFKGVKVEEYKQDNLYKYTSGSFENDFKAANELKIELRKTGFPNAFVVAFQNGERINLEKAIKLAEK